MDKLFRQLLIAPLLRRPDSIEEVRRLLAELPPYEILRLLSEKNTPAAKHANVRSHFEGFRSKRQLLKWVYADSAAFADDVRIDDRLLDYTQWQNLKRPSRTKTVLVDRICGGVGRRYPWMSRKLLHAFAFRPAYFENSPFNAWSKAKGLYYRRQLLKRSGGVRHLWVPIPPLRRIQRTLLRCCLDQAQETLTDAVMGARRRLHPDDPPFGIFRNAARHIGQTYVASYDLKDFFPSVRADQVVQALMRLEAPVGIDDNGAPLLWTHDAAVLVARLVTRRGRLPQGAPTSPAIANLVFGPLDEKIQERLGSYVVYSRYFDDMTMSISSPAARRLQLDSPAAFRDYTSAVIEDVLRGTPFRINSRKTRVTSLKHGHRVTGLRVTDERVTLPRKSRRALRALLHQVQRDGLVVAARRHVDNALVARTTYEGDRGRHVESTRRLSTERLAVQMLRQLCGDLRIEVPSETWHLGGKRIHRQEELHEGNVALRTAERLLTQLWRNEVSVCLEDGHVVVTNSEGMTAARLRCDRNEEFFLLSRRDALLVVELWHQLRGWYSGLNPSDRQDCFAPLEDIRRQIADVLESAAVSADRVERRRDIPDASDTPRMSLLHGVPEFEAAAREAWKYLTEFELESSGGTLGADAVRSEADLGVPVNSLEELAEWLPTIEKLAIGGLSSFPADEKGAIPHIFHVIHILGDRLAERRSFGYVAEKQFLGSHVRKSSVRELADANALKVQTAVLEELSSVLRASVKNKSQQSDTAWTGQLVRNPWGVPLAERLRAAFQQLVTELENAKWQTTGEPVFSDNAIAEIEKNPSLLHESIRAESSRDVWEELFAFSSAFAGAILENLQGDDETFSEEVRERLGDRGGRLHEKLYEELYHEVGDARSAFNVAWLMRHRHAHSEDAGKAGEWNTIQKYVAKALQRQLDKADKRRKGQALFGPGDLKLTTLEGTEVKLHLLQAVGRGLSQLRPKKGKS